MPNMHALIDPVETHPYDTEEQRNAAWGQIFASVRLTYIANLAAPQRPEDNGF